MMPLQSAQIIQRCVSNMFVVSCYYDKQKSIIGETISSIRQFHPEEKIVICDSDSKDKSYAQEYISDYVEFFDAKNTRRPIGALLETYKKYPNEPYYILMHDSSSLRSSIQKFIERDEELIAFFQTPRTISTIPSNAGFGAYFNWMEKLFSKLNYELNEDFRVDGSYSVCVGCMGIYKNSLLKKFFQNGMYEAMESYSFEDFQWAERAIGYIAKLEGINLETSCIEGDAISVWYDMPTGRLPYIKKICAGR
mgnify:CR=1 FL=1